jgi:carbonic anhydrase
VTSTLPPPMNAATALDALREGNARFASNVRSIDALASQARRETFADGQSPNAIILSCADSRVPSELVFDCGLGDLFVVRVAGNICAPSLVGSVEYAASMFGTELVVVMGHTQCGAVKATVSSLLEKGDVPSENIRDIVERISPAVVPLLDKGLEPKQLLREATRANVRHTADHLRHASKILERRILDGKLVVVGAEYSIETGRVDFFDVPLHGVGKSDVAA